MLSSSIKSHLENKKELVNKASALMPTTQSEKVQRQRQNRMSYNAFIIYTFMVGRSTFTTVLMPLMLLYLLAQLRALYHFVL